jgi:hypothetical protein
MILTQLRLTFPRPNPTLWLYPRVARSVPKFQSWISVAVVPDRHPQVDGFHGRRHRQECHRMRRALLVLPKQSTKVKVLAPATVKRTLRSVLPADWRAISESACAGAGVDAPEHHVVAGRPEVQDLGRARHPPDLG